MVINYDLLVFEFGDKKKTEVKTGTLEPEWNEKLQWDLSSKGLRPDECIDITVKDHERLGKNKLLGKATIALRNVVHSSPGTPLDYELRLFDASDSPTVGTLKLVISYKPPAIPDVGVDGVGGAGGIMPHLPPQQRNRDKLSNVKTKFQVRVRVVEGRQLLGANMNPVCRVSLDGNASQTRVHKGTNTPWFDQIFFFQVDKIPGELMEDFLEFKFEVGMAYDQAEHAVLNRWLVLANPDEPTPTVQGYLKVSVAVLGPGDLCPEMAARQSDQDDVEANLLRFAGVHLQQATFVLSVYCAQNLPRMDPGVVQSIKKWFGIGKVLKDLVDPYLVASYAGKNERTKIISANENPQFRQNLHIRFIFPSMCNVIKITLMDWDRVGDDTIGTATIPVSAISAPGEEGFLPTFGPAWVNVYGARREWELLESDGEGSMNKGWEAGCAYRGSVLLALHTKIGSYPSARITPMDYNDFNKIRRFRRTRKFVVMCQLSGAWLLGAAGKPLEVEMSVGNFGNKLENTMLPSPSSTNPANPVFDGCKYYFLPWYGVEPFVTIHCDFEDVTHRLHAVNHITSIITSTQQDLGRVESLLRGNKEGGSKEVQEALLEACRRLTAACSELLPEVDPVRHIETSLDIHLKAHRQGELAALGKAAESWHQSEPSQVVTELQAALNKLDNLAQEPQSSIPDVFLWLMSGIRRLAYVRIPAHSVLSGHTPSSHGALAGRFNTFALINPDDESGCELGGVVRASVWLGREEEASTWWDARPHLQLTVYAETYENQVTSVPWSGWTDSGLLMTRPKFSDADGRLSLPREAFPAPDSWAFQGDWFIGSDPSVRFEADAGHQLFTEEVFELNDRLPGGTWIPAPTPWTDVRGDPATERDKVELPRGWQWREEWTYDLQRAVDGEGWEYTVESGLVGWSPQEKIYHLKRRRRWVRERHLVEKVEKVSNGDVMELVQVDGWEYANNFLLQFHAPKETIDMVRRRRWRRRLVPTEPGLPPTPRLSIKTGKGDDEITLLTCPRMYVASAERYKYQLRAHIYQARDLPAGDETGLSDPYAVVSFCNGTQQTEKQSKTLCPTWDQTLIFDDVELTGPVSDTAVQAPKIVIEVFDRDARGAPEFLGRVFCSPSMIYPGQGYQPLPLQWYPLSVASNNQGELLASFELLLKGGEELPILPPTRGDLYMVPSDVRPQLQKTRVEVLCWGVRNMSTFGLQRVTRPSIEFECGGGRITSPVMSNLRLNPNFDKPHLFFDVELPKEELYMPPLTLCIMDNQAFGRKPVVATAVVTDLHKYIIEPKTTRLPFVIVASKDMGQRVALLAGVCAQCPGIQKHLV
ncbi:hypothetical protein Pcinc_005570 [Petrolisthes cinctipes]|uniref:C2 domain-containing protein n=2 Tax=Petrolisthes cinctipes TaxID=88211 RepID=A0AAE1GD35_PETCI|nr:hypothetical protein Pcinc_005570 [Petrolisthes cinctipes]